MQTNPKLRPSPSDPKEFALCWKEIIQAALDGLFPDEPTLEEMLDRYERMP